MTKVGTFILKSLCVVCLCLGLIGCEGEDKKKDDDEGDTKETSSGSTSTSTDKATSTNTGMILWECEANCNSSSLNPANIEASDLDGTWATELGSSITFTSGSENLGELSFVDATGADGNGSFLINDTNLVFTIAQSRSSVSRLSLGLHSFAIQGISEAGLALDSEKEHLAEREDEGLVVFNCVRGCPSLPVVFPNEATIDYLVGTWETVVSGVEATIEIGSDGFYTADVEGFGPSTGQVEMDSGFISIEVLGQTFSLLLVDLGPQQVTGLLVDGVAPFNAFCVLIDSNNFPTCGNGDVDDDTTITNAHFQGIWLSHGASTNQFVFISQAPGLFTMIFRDGRKIRGRYDVLNNQVVSFNIIESNHSLFPFGTSSFGIGPLGSNNLGIIAIR